ncbi:MAG TPA: outer membrane beta-barrel protein [Vicinamibacterales bacterium]|nr:outer membrane beta-barrel protein [Vicinamibacterales bacterium]
MDVSEDQDIDDDVESFDFGLVLGAGIDASRLTFDGRYTWGLTSIANTPVEDDVQVKNRTFSLMIGFRI